MRKKAEDKKTTGQRPLRILLADDFDMNRQIIRAYLKNTDCLIEEVLNGERAVEKVKEQPFDLVLMDVQMPLMDGYRAAKAIRAWEKANGRSAVPIVALTGHSYEEDIKKSLDAGCTAHLSKPIERKSLFEMIATLTAGASAAKEEPPRVVVEFDLQHLIPTFMEDMVASRHSIDAAVLLDDLDAIMAVCHRIKGTAGMFGFNELSRIGETLETAAVVGDRAEIHRLAAHLARHLSEVKIDYT